MKLTYLSNALFRHPTLPIWTPQCRADCKDNITLMLCQLGRWMQPAGLGCIHFFVASKWACGEPPCHHTPLSTPPAQSGQSPSFSTHLSPSLLIHLFHLTQPLTAPHPIENTSRYRTSVVVTAVLRLACGPRRKPHGSLSRWAMCFKKRSTTC